MPATRKKFLLASAAASAAGLAFPNVVLGKGEPIRLGLLPPITGAQALLGQQEQEGAKFAVDEINARPGKVFDDRPFELVIEDATSDNQSAVGALNKLLGENVDAVVCPVLSTQIQAMAPVMKGRQEPWMTGGTAVKNTQLGLTNIFRCRASDGITAQAMTGFAVEQLHGKKIAIFHSSEAFGTGGADQVEASLAKFGLKAVAREQYPNGTKDFTAEILRIKQAGADVVVGYIQNPSDVAVILSQYNSLGMKTPLVGSPSVGNQTAIDTAGKNSNGMYCAQDFILGFNSNVATKFVTGFYNRYHHVPDVSTGSGWVYDAIRLLADTYKKIGSIDKTKTALALHQTKHWEGVLGDFTCDAEGNMIHAMSIGRIENGKVSLVKKVVVAA
ncbi:MAG: ABC transporter substrate-binding protein [Candidatus Eremiobacteraeota bacterium]|nr:ABC transporter substrate-binding protein [Candidatus Eremiobacteraeota bacterium]